MPPRHPRNFLVLLQQEVNDPTTWVLRPGTQDNSIWKLVVTSNSPECVRQAEYAMLARVCPRSNNVATVGRQLGYWMFQKLKSGQTHLLDVEVEPGRIITLTYHQYNHAPTLSEVDTMWSNARGYPHGNHRRRTNNGMGSSTGVYLDPDRCGTKRAVEATATTPSPKKLRTVEELLQDDDMVIELIKQFECAEDPDPDDADILEAAKLDLDYYTMEALFIDVSCTGCPLGSR